MAPSANHWAVPVWSKHHHQAGWEPRVPMCVGTRLPSRTGLPTPAGNASARRSFSISGRSPRTQQQAARLPQRQRDATAYPGRYARHVVTVPRHAVVAVAVQGQGGVRADACGRALTTCAGLRPNNGWPGPCGKGSDQPGRGTSTVRSYISRRMACHLVDANDSSSNLSCPDNHGERAPPAPSRPRMGSAAPRKRGVERRRAAAGEEVLRANMKRSLARHLALYHHFAVD